MTFNIPLLLSSSFVMEDGHDIISVVTMLAQTVGLAVAIYYVCKAISKLITKNKGGSRGTNNILENDKENDEHDNDRILVPLSAADIHCFLNGNPSMETITWFEFKGDFTVIVKHFEQRTNKIIKANPWLLGEIVRKKSRGKYFISYSIKKIENNPFSLSDVFKVVRDTNDCPISSDADIRDNFNKCQQAGCHPENDADPCQLPFWVVSLIPSCKVPNQFALVMYLSHTIGDGLSFYQVYEHLVSSINDKPIPSLQIKRIETSPQEHQQLMGEKEANMTSCPGFKYSVLRGDFMKKIYGPLTNTTHKYKSILKIFLIDMDKIRELKETYAQEDQRKNKPVPFISSNDIITSWFLSKLGNANGKNMNHGFMVANLRDRIPSHTKAHVGNYIGHIYYKLPQDTSSPALIRQSLHSMKRTVTTDEPISNKEWARFDSTCLFTNVASIYPGKDTCPAKTKENLKNLDNFSLGGGVELKQLFHFPYLSEDTKQPTFIFSMIFMARSNPMQYGVVIAATPDLMHEMVDGCPFLLPDSLQSLASS